VVHCWCWYWLCTVAAGKIFISFLFLLKFIGSYAPTCWFLILVLVDLDCLPFWTNISFVWALSGLAFFL
jgi:hypothetical protein